MSILYTRFAPRMLHVISRYVSDRDSTHDILHDGFIAAFTRLDTLRDPERIDLWLATIMKNLSLKYLQEQSVTSILDEMPETIEESEIDDVIDFATLESLIRQLPEGYQKVFRLAVLENKSHKEISEILGIAPNSSSSQLFHAKLRLRELIKDYQLRAGLLSFLLMLASAGILFLYRNIDMLPSSDRLMTDSSKQRPISSLDNKVEPLHENLSNDESTLPIIQKTRRISLQNMHTTVVGGNDDKVSGDSILIYSANPSTSVSDSAEYSSPALEMKNQSGKAHQDSEFSLSDRLFAQLPHKATTGKGWSVGITVEPGMFSFNGINMGVLDSSRPPQETEQPPYGPDEDTNSSSTPAKMPRSKQDIGNYLGSASHCHHLPLSFALTSEKKLSSKLGLETGIGYSYLHSDFEHYSNNGSNVSTCHWHYLEIPLKMNLYAYTSSRMNIYFGLAGRVSIPVYSYAHIAPNPYCRSGRFNSKPVWSAGGSVGMAFRLSKHLDVFVEPSLQYHFPQESTIPNIWTDDEPWSISIPIGFRFRW